MCKDVDASGAINEEKTESGKVWMNSRVFRMLRSQPLTSLKPRVHQYQNVEKVHESTIKTLERQLERAETEIRPLNEQRDAASSQPSEERLLALERIIHMRKL
ncbi:hypothetical protein PsorP6_015455 [Peronosclerospora sorghi]|uniref:Uncharacterized protein n=1 Tax=Peronosclerospora sorghi TaxID=230839 RepID=A0ACC0WQA2_9STRA|nr:hypothetical protein PsorP6_015455 [Peronosclerospora sorghi]